MPVSVWRISPSVFVARPRLLIAAAAGVAVDAGLLGLTHIRPSTGLILGWDVFCAVFLILAARMVAGQDPGAIAKRAATQDEGQHIILFLVIGAAVASLAAVAAELAVIGKLKDVVRVLHVGLAVTAVAGSWLVTQTIFALHYAHEYYARDAGGAPARGLAFPGEENPDYWDFLHFAIIIGAASQTADIAITDRSLRRLGTVHSLIAFVFNTLVIALTVTLVGELF
jgi:uncharacterized membrane protein